jgi:serine phosphatase RsbU (regulator of sigma subunit)/CHASE2 domain-containing sensor protein
MLVLAALAIAYGCYGLFPANFQTWDSRIVDRLFVLRTKVNPMLPRDLDAVVHVDANNYFSLSQHAQVIGNLAAMNVSAQLVDFIFADMNSENEDRPLIQATQKAGNVYYGLRFESLIEQPADRKLAPDTERISRSDTRSWPVVFEDNPESLYAGIAPTMTYPELAAVARGIGFLNLTPDPDGIIRRLPLLVRYQGVYYPSLALRAVCDYLKVPPQKVIVKPGKSITLKDAQRGAGAVSGDIVIPIDKSGSMFLNGTEFWNDVRHYSSSEIFQASEKPAQLAELKKELSGKIAVLSETLEKKYKTRVSGDQKLLYSGAIHTLVLQNILSGSFLRRLSQPVAVLIEIGLLGVIFFLSMRFSSPVLSLQTVFMGAAYTVLAAGFFFYTGVIFQFVRPLAIMLSALGFLLIGLGIEKALLFSQTERARRIAERELEIGREIQSGFFPNVLPVPAGWQLATHFQAARHVAGDFYDVFTLGEEKRIGLVIADVCDKGVGAALFMALFRSFIRVLSGSAHSDGHLEISNPSKSPEKILKHSIRSINNYISITHEKAGMFATIFYAILDPPSGRLTYINGGHEPPIIIGKNGIKASLEPTGPAVGLYPDLKFNTGTVQLEPEDMLLIYTDGVIDAQNKTGKAFTKKNLMKVLAEPSQSAQNLIDRIQTEINHHTLDETQFDDITIMALRRDA